MQLFGVGTGFRGQILASEQYEKGERLREFCISKLSNPKREMLCHFKGLSAHHLCTCISRKPYLWRHCDQLGILCHNHIFLSVETHRHSSPDFHWYLVQILTFMVFVTAAKWHYTTTLAPLLSFMKGAADMGNLKSKWALCLHNASVDINKPYTYYKDWKLNITIREMVSHWDLNALWDSCPLWLFEFISKWVRRREYCSLYLNWLHISSGI